MKLMLKIEMIDHIKELFRAVTIQSKNANQNFCYFLKTEVWTFK